MTTTSKPRASMARTTTAGNSPSPATNPTRSGIVIGLLILGSIALPRAKPPTNAAFRPLDKRDQTPGLVAGQARVPHVVQRLRGVETGAIEQAIGAPQFPSHRGREAEATHPHDVEPPDAGGVALGDHKGWDVFHDARRAADHGQIPDADKLVYGAMAGDEGTIPDAGHPILFGRAVGRYVLADAGMGADMQERAVSPVCESLRRAR